jgi:hypothetical protein
MPIVPSRARDIQRLAADLGAASAAVRESAVARLTLLGERAVEPLLALLRSAAGAARLAALDVLEALRSDPRVLPGVLALVGDRDTRVAQRAIEIAGESGDARAVGALGGVAAKGVASLRHAAIVALGRLHAAGLVLATDQLLDVVTDEQQDEAARLEAFDTLESLPAKDLKALKRRLRGSTSTALAARAAGRLDPDQELLESALRERTPGSILVLHRLLERIEDAESRARVHTALAGLGSRIALYDLREMLEARPVRAAAPLLDAAARLGDASLVPTLAALVADTPELLEACAAAFASIAVREKLRRASRVSKGVRTEHREALAELWARTPTSKRKP